MLFLSRSKNKPRQTSRQSPKWIHLHGGGGGIKDKGMPTASSWSDKWRHGEAWCVSWMIKSINRIDFITWVEREHGHLFIFPWIPHRPNHDSCLAIKTEVDGCLSFTVYDRKCIAYPETQQVAVPRWPYALSTLVSYWRPTTTNDQL